MTMIKTLFRDKPYLVLLKLLEVTEETKTISWLHWKTKITFGHVDKIIEKMGEQGLVTTEKTGRIKEVVLTRKGRIFALGVEELVEKLEVIENEK